VQLFSETPHLAEPPAGKDVTVAGEEAERLDRLELQVSELFREISELRERLDGLAAE
jgi:hypothetical protein